MCVIFHQSQVEKEEAEAQAASWGCAYVETSAKTSTNVDKVSSLLFVVNIE